MQSRGILVIYFANPAWHGFPGEAHAGVRNLKSGGPAGAEVSFNGQRDLHNPQKLRPT